MARINTNRSKLLHRAIQCTLPLALLATVISASSSMAQGFSTASRQVAPSVFGGISSTSTGLNGSKNVGVTAGLNFGFHTMLRLAPSFEVRGTFPLSQGSVV